MWIYDLNSIDIFFKHRVKAIKELIFIRGKGLSKLNVIEQDAVRLNIPYTWKEKDEIARYLGRSPNRNVRLLANIREKTYLQYNELKHFLEQNKDNDRKSLLVILDQITDTRNFGAVIRSASAFGIDKLIVHNIKNSPISAEVYTSSVGTVELIDIVSVNNIAQTIKLLKDYGYWIYGYSLDDKASNIYDLKFAQKSAFVFGNEHSGIRELVKKSCDFIVQIPMHKNVDSLNISVSAGISMFEFNRQY